jgi:RHS repeat-associated protein
VPRHSALRRAPQVVALEDREAPQFVVLLPFAAEMLGAAAVVAAGSMLANQTAAHGADVINLRDAAANVPESPQTSRVDVARVDAAFARTEEIAVLNQTEDGDYLFLTSLDRTDLSRSPLNERAPGIIPAIMPAVEGSFGAPAELLERPPASADLTPPLAGEPESGGGGDNPNLVGKSPPITAASTTAQGTKPAQMTPSSPAAPQAPAPGDASTALSSADVNALAHGLVNQATLSPTRIPPTISHPPIHPLGPRVPGILVTGPDAGSQPLVKVFDATTYALKFTIMAYDPSFTGGVRVAVGDITGPGSQDIVTAPGPGGGSLIKVWNSTTGALESSFNAYDAGQTDGAFVAAGDVNGDGHADIITGTDVGAKPLVKVFSGVDNSLLSSFISDPEAGANGVRVAAGDVAGLGYADIITGAGPGGPGRVTVVDGQTGNQLYNFFPFGDTFTGGVYVASGDLNGDHHADIIAGEGSGDVPLVRAYSGLNLAPLGSVMAYDSSFSGGVRVAAEDVTGTGQLDIITAQGPGGNQLAAFDGNYFRGINVLTPYPGSTAGFFVAGDGQLRSNRVGRLDGGLPNVTLTTSATVVKETGTSVFTFTRDGSTANPLTVNFTVSGTGVVSQDYQSLGAGQIVINSGQSSATDTLTTLEDNKFDGPETVVVTLASNQNYNIGSPSSATVEIIDDLPTVVPTNDCGCSGGKNLVNVAGGVAANGATSLSQAGVRYADGAVKQGASQLSSSGFGVGWGQDWSWSNYPGYSATTFTGAGSVASELPYLQVDGSSNISLVSNGTTARAWDAQQHMGQTTYNARYFLPESLSDNTTNGEMTVTDSTGEVLKFYDFGSVPPAARKGLFKSLTDQYGNVTSVTSWTGDKPAEVRRSNGSLIESYQYSYIASGVNAGLLSGVVLRRSTDGGSTWTTVRQTAYTYYDGTTANGNANDLKLVQVEDGATPTPNVLDTSYYRYYKSGDANGYAHGLKFAFGPQSYARLVAALGSNVDSLTDSQVSPYADANYQYDGAQRVSQGVIQGSGCSACSGGLGTFAYAYTPSSFPDGYNNWHEKVTETLPDNNLNIVYTNTYGEVLLSVFKDVGTGATWDTYNKYDNQGRLIEQASPSAVTGYDDTQASLGVTLSTNSGLITDTDYGTSTTATSSTAGDVNGYYKDTKIQQGSGGSTILQSQTQYFSQTANNITIYPTANNTVYRNTDGTGAETTSYSYTWFTGTNQMQSMTVTKPGISATQNGPGTSNPDTETQYFDQYGRPTWHKDGDGFINYTEYDQATGSVSKTITDVDTTKTSDFMNLPSGWVTPAGGGLHLKTLMTVDALGRTTKLTDPAGDVTYTVYIDTNYEVRTYPGWNSNTNLPTGPTLDSREDRPGSYTESLTMSATPHLTNNAPDGTEAIGNVQSLSRSYTNKAGQMVRSDAYFNLSGVTWSTAQYIGTQNTNFYTSLYDYDHRGRQNRVQLPTGTINRTVYDGLSRVISTWIGTNDTPPSGEWSPTNNGAPSNMVQITGNVYDTFTAPAAPTLSQTRGGTLAATTYYVKVAYVFNGPSGPGSAESSLAVSANNLLQVSSPSSVPGATGYNVYVASASGQELLQNGATPIAIGTNWTEPTSGLVTGTVAPFTNGVGDSLLTQSTQYPGGSAANRVTNNYFDWRDRLVATKSGVQASEDTTTHRPILYYTFDNLSETTSVDRYDGDTVTITSTNGVPQAPSSSLLRAHTVTSYDDQGRVYLSQTYSVDPSSGAVSTNSLNTNTWYNHRGQVLETSPPGVGEPPGVSPRVKSAYDGAGRTTTSYTTDGNGDAAPGTTNSWANAGTVSSTNNVLEQTESTYDADSNVLLTTTRQRNHDETTGGPLGNETTTPKARVSFVAAYYDLANRLTTTVDVGTNGTGTYTRPSTPPAASDTVLRTDTSYAGDNVQLVQLTGNPTGGTFTLTFNGQTTSAIAYNASAATVQSALQALSTIGSGNALVASPTGSGWIVRFAGTLAGAVQPALTGNGSGLTGGTNPSVAITVTSLGGDNGQVQQTTDPRGIISKTDYDYLGRTVRTIEAFSAFAPSNNLDKTTEYTYDGSSHMLTLQADLASSAYQQTKFIYGVTTTSSAINSNDIQSAMQYPDKTTGNPSSTEQESYTVNAVGQRTTFTDRNGSVHTYSYDVLGRLTSDSITTLGSGVDGAVRRIDTAYDTQGNSYLFTSYADTAGTTIVNQVQRKFNGLGQLIQEWQAHSGAVNTSTTPSVQYGWSLMSGGANHSRLTSITYPNGKVLNYNYASGLDDSISRLTSLSDTSGTLEQYSYLGLSTVVKRAHPLPTNGLDLTYITPGGSGDAGDQYTGLDRFGRVVEQKWQTEQMTPTVTDDFKYGYDRDSNRLYRTNEVNHNFDELYHANGSSNGYDNLNQLTAFARGTLNGTHDTITSPTHSQSWSLDAAGNFSSQTTDGTQVNRTHNKQNQVTGVGSSTLTFDANGNLTKDDAGQQYVFDAWNRLVAVKNSGGSTITSYKVDALGRRIVENPGTARDLYYSAAWQVLEERLGGVSTATVQYVWSPAYVDALIERDRSTQNNGTLDERLYAQQDANYNVTGLVNASGAAVERYVYDSYGKQIVLDGSWNTRTSSSYAFIIGFQGARLDTTSGLYNERNRDLSPTLGRWMGTDPSAYAAEDNNLYRSFSDNPTTHLDPTALQDILYAFQGLLPGTEITAPDPAAFGLDDGKLGYSFSLFLILFDAPKAKGYVLQGNKGRTLGMKANGDIWKPDLQQEDGFDYIVDHFTYSGTETQVKDDVSLSKALGKQKGVITKDDWALFYRSVQKQSGISILDWKPPKGVQSGQMVGLGIYNGYLKAMRKKPVGKTTYTYVYINCANLKKNKIDLKGKRPEKIPEDVWDGIQAMIKKAGDKFKDGAINEILSTPALTNKYDPLVGTHD